MKFSSRARWSDVQRHPEADVPTGLRTYRGRNTSRRSSSIYPVHLGG